MEFLICKWLTKVTAYINILFVGNVYVNVSYRFMATIKDIAKKSGYSIGTVSRVINRHKDVSDEARKIIEKVIEEENFQPNMNARNLKQTNGNAIAILIVGHGNLLFADLLEKVQEELDKSGEEAAVFYLDEKSNQVQDALHIVLERKPKGIIFLGGNLNYFDRSFEKIKIPCVLLTNQAETLGFPNLSSFTTDDIEASKKAMQIFIENGHKNIAIIGGSKEHSQATNRRLEGCKSALHNAGISFDETKQYIETRYSMQEGYDGCKVLMQNNPNTTAIFALSDSIAIGVIRALKDIGKSVPEDVSLIGFDGITIGQYNTPRLTTIQQDTKNIAQRGVKNLLLRLNYDFEAVHEKVPFTFLEGETVKRI